MDTLIKISIVTGILFVLCGCAILGPRTETISLGLKYLPHISENVDYYGPAPLLVERDMVTSFTQTITKDNMTTTTSMITYYKPSAQRATSFWSNAFTSVAGFIAGSKF